MPVAGWEQPRVPLPLRPFLSPDPVGDSVPGGELAGHEAGPRRAADLAGRVTLSEPHSLASDPIDVRRLVERAALDPHVAPAVVVHQDEHHVGTLRGRGGRTGQQDEGKCQLVHFRSSLQSMPSASYSQGAGVRDSAPADLGRWSDDSALEQSPREPPLSPRRRGAAAGREGVEAVTCRT